MICAYVIYLTSKNLDINQEIMGKVGSISHSWCIYYFLKTESMKMCYYIGEWPRVQCADTQTIEL